ncbi:MAG: hypothetical protein J2P15_08030 [Micromonosporaceae bacterium]|nr:hypothetical protein [Micromonosporaceae bacterium]
MTIQIPSRAAELLNDLGYFWPETDEDKVRALGQMWTDLASTLQPIHADADAAAAQVVRENNAQSIEAFRQLWGQDERAARTLGRGELGAQAIAGALAVCAAAVVALKVNVIIQLGLLAVEIVQAIATAEVTLGASLLEIPAFKTLTGLAINYLISQAMKVILG